MTRAPGACQEAATQTEEALEPLEKDTQAAALVTSDVTMGVSLSRSLSFLSAKGEDNSRYFTDLHALTLENSSALCGFEHQIK